MFQLIAGPCVIESEEMVLSIAGQMKEITEQLGIPYTFKASFDKANRTSLHSFRGPGLEEGLRILKKVKDVYGLPIFMKPGRLPLRPRWLIFYRFRHFFAGKRICWLPPQRRAVV